MGTKMNKALDSRAFAKALGRWCRVSLRFEFSLPWYQRFARDLDFRLAQIRHCAALPSANHPWGVKNPRTILMLPYLNQKYPGMRFLHVVRDGRDMAFSKNQNQLEKYGEFLFESEELTNTLQPVRSMMFWSRVNLRTSNFAEIYLPGRYLRVNFEDLCGDPETIVRSIFDFLGNPSAGVQAAVSEVLSPPTIGRWRYYDADTVAQVIEAGKEALEKFGYSNS
jgi:hypothetical protein